MMEEDGRVVTWIPTTRTNATSFLFIFTLTLKSLRMSKAKDVRRLVSI